MHIHRDYVDLISYAVRMNGLTVLPISIDANDEDNTCVVVFRTLNKVKIHHTLVRKGTHKDFMFTTSINNVPFVINLKTGRIKKIRKPLD